MVPLDPAASGDVCGNSSLGDICHQCHLKANISSTGTSNTEPLKGLSHDGCKLTPSITDSSAEINANQSKSVTANNNNQRGKAIGSVKGKPLTLAIPTNNKNGSCNSNLVDKLAASSPTHHHHRQDGTPKLSFDSSLSDSSYSSFSTASSQSITLQETKLNNSVSKTATTIRSKSNPNPDKSNKSAKRSVSFIDAEFSPQSRECFKQRSSVRMQTNNLSSNLSSTPPKNVPIIDLYNDSRLENSNDHSPEISSNIETKNQTYKDRRKNYRIEKKKLADELISAIQDPTTIVISDWIKVRTTLKQWNKYFCELRPGSLYLYKNQKIHKSSNWIGTVMLKMCELIERPSKKNGFCFKLFHPLDHPIWSPKGPHGEAITSIMFPLPISSVIFRAPSEEAGLKWMQAIELSLKCSDLIVHKHQPSRDSVPNTPLSVTSNGSGGISTNHISSHLNNISVDRCDDELLNSQHDSEIEKHFDLDDDGHTDHGEHEDSHHTTDSEDSIFEEDDDDTRFNYDLNESGVQNTLKPNCGSKSNLESDIVESSYIFDGGIEEFGLVGDAGQTEDVPEENKSLLWTLLKQVRPGMDLSKVVLPTFILEPRSFLEKLTDYYYHCDIISKAVLEDDPLLRMKLVLKWYLSGFYKKPKGLKKPYNPILGETFRCCWHHPESNSRTYYIAEQVSHHPPVSAFYVTNRQDGFCISGSIMAKSKFYGNSISAILEGTARLSLLSRGEDYLITFPYAHCKGIFLGPLAFELGGKITIACDKTGYKTELEFKLKPFFGSEDQCNLVIGKLRLGNETLGTIEGHWDAEIMYKDKRKGESELFWSGIDPNVKSSRLRRFVVPLDDQLDTESEKLWNKVTIAIQQQDQHSATVEKTVLEEAQREATKERTSRMEMWSPKLFLFENDWQYKMAEVRPWDIRTDVKQYEHNYVIRTLTRHLSSQSQFSVNHPPNGDQVVGNLFEHRPTFNRPNRKKFSRANTCTDSTTSRHGMNGLRDNLFNDSKQRGHKISARNSDSGESIAEINSQLKQIKNTLTTLEQGQCNLKHELNQLRSTMLNGSNPPASKSGHYLVRTQSSFSITKYRLNSLFLMIPSEVRHVLLVLLAHILFGWLSSFFSKGSSVSFELPSQHSAPPPSLPSPPPPPQPSQPSPQ